MILRLQGLCPHSRWYARPAHIVSDIGSQKRQHGRTLELSGQSRLQAYNSSMSCVESFYSRYPTADVAVRVLILATSLSGYTLVTCSFWGYSMRSTVNRTVKTLCVMCPYRVSPGWQGTERDACWAKRR